MSEYDERMMKTKHGPELSHNREVDVKWFLLRVSFPDTCFWDHLFFVKLPHILSPSLLFATYFFFFKQKNLLSSSHVNFNKNIFSFYFVACLDISLFVQLFLPYSSNKSSKVRHATYIGGEVLARCVLVQEMDCDGMVVVFLWRR